MTVCGCDVIWRYLRRCTGAWFSSAVDSGDGRVSGVAVEIILPRFVTGTCIRKANAAVHSTVLCHDSTCTVPVLDDRRTRNGSDDKLTVLYSRE